MRFQWHCEEKNSKQYVEIETQRKHTREKNDTVAFHYSNDI